MGYNTKYELECDVPGLVRKILKKFEETADEDDVSANFTYALTSEGDTNCDCKWYDHEEDLRELSLSNPEVIFTLRGEGEDSGDMWVKYFRNGKMQVAKAVITFEPMCLGKME